MILKIFRPNCVLVGPDQKQHLELVDELTARLWQVCGVKVVDKPTPLISKNFDFDCENINLNMTM